MRTSSGVLKRDMGFDGFVISDWEGIHQIPTEAGLSDDEKWAVQVRTGDIVVIYLYGTASGSALGPTGPCSRYLTQDGLWA